MYWSDISESNDNEQVKHWDGGDWNGEAEQERVPDERLFGGDDSSVGEIDGAWYVAVFFNGPVHESYSHIILAN